MHVRVLELNTNTLLLTIIILILASDRIQTWFAKGSGSLKEPSPALECRDLSAMKKHYGSAAEDIDCGDDNKTVKVLLNLLLQKTEQEASSQGFAANSNWSEIISLCIVTCGLIFLIKVGVNEYSAFVKMQRELQSNAALYPVSIGDFFKYRYSSIGSAYI